MYTLATHNNNAQNTEKLSQSPPQRQKRLNCHHFLYSLGTLHSFHVSFRCKSQAGQQRRNCEYTKSNLTFPIKDIYRNTRCNFWLIKHVDKSIEPSIGIFGNGCVSSQHHRTSRTNSIHRKAMARDGMQKTKEKYNTSHQSDNSFPCLTGNLINFAYNELWLIKCGMVYWHIPRILQLPNHSECKQNCVKRDSSGAALRARESMCSPLVKSGSLDPARLYWNKVKQYHISWILTNV